MTKRNLLTVKRLPEFEKWMQKFHGFRSVPTKNCFEAIRLKKDKITIIIHERINNNSGSQLTHLTVWGDGLTWVHKFLRETKDSAL